MRKSIGHVLLSVSALAIFPGTASAGIADGVHNSIITYCFVGNATTAKPDDVKFITDHLKIFENYGHIKYELMANGGVCPAPTQTPDGAFDVHEGDLRIGVPGTVDFDGTTPITGLKLGKGCEDDGTTGWWGRSPFQLNDAEFRACRLSAFLRKGMALNKILHEIGHTLGFVHEHLRTDIASINDPMVKVCFKDVSYYGKEVSQGPDMTLFTPYDRDSVMHYEINTTTDPDNVPAGSTCNIGNDNGTTGLSDFDKLSVRIMYPHDKKTAEYIGVTVIAAGKKLQLQSEWGASGALTQNVLKNPQWVLQRKGANTATIQNSPNFNFALNTAGDYTMTYTFKDFRDRTFANTFAVKVLPAATLTKTMGAIVAGVPLL